jgi:hypothetical protein
MQQALTCRADPPHFFVSLSYVFYVLHFWAFLSKWSSKTPSGFSGKEDLLIFFTKNEINSMSFVFICFLRVWMIFYMRSSKAPKTKCVSYLFQTISKKAPTHLRGRAFLGLFIASWGRLISWMPRFRVATKPEPVAVPVPSQTAYSI